MTAILKLDVERRNAIESSLFGLECEKNALQVLANEHCWFAATEPADLRRIAHELMGIAQQVEANLPRGSR